jgi:hypothetical protein
MIQALQPRHNRRFRAAKHSTGKAACFTVRSGATMKGMDLRAIEGFAVIPGYFSMAGAAP